MCGKATFTNLNSLSGAFIGVHLWSEKKFKIPARPMLAKQLGVQCAKHHRSKLHPLIHYREAMHSL